MPERGSDALLNPKQYQMALSRWDNEGGAVCDEMLASNWSNEAQTAPTRVTNVELMQLRVRVIALENLVIALLAEASDRQLNFVRDLVTRISPEPTFTQHPLTIRAAGQMTNLVKKAARLRESEPS